MRIKELRKLKGVTLKAMGEELGLSSQVVSRYELEQTEPDFETLIHIADYFGVSVDYLLGRSNSPGYSPAENKLGFDVAANIPLSDDEYELILTYRKLGNKKGSAFQRLVREHMDKLLSI